MTNFIKVFFIFFIFFSVQGQEKVVEIQNVSLDKLYLGLYGKQLVRTDSNYIYNNSYLRFGALLSRNFAKKIKVRSFGLIKLETKELIKSSGSFEIVYQSNPNNRIQLGFVGTAFSEIRPNPLTPESQTEYITQSKIPGAKPTIKYFHSFTESNSLSTSISFNNGLVGYQLKYLYKNLTLGFQWEKYNIIGALDFQFKGLRSIAVYNYSSKICNQTLIYSLKKYQLYTENELSLINEKKQNFEIGVRNNFENKANQFKGFIGLAYNNNQNIIACNLFIHFNEEFLSKSK